MLAISDCERRGYIRPYTQAFRKHGSGDKDYNEYIRAFQRNVHKLIIKRIYIKAEGSIKIEDKYRNTEGIIKDKNIFSNSNKKINDGNLINKKSRNKSKKKVKKLF
jgi:hypothetical protein